MEVLGYKVIFEWNKPLKLYIFGHKLILGGIDLSNYRSFDRKCVWVE